MGGGSVLTGSTQGTMRELSKQLGGVKTSPIIKPKTQTMITGKTFIPDLTSKKKKRL